ncbi:polysaccharide deacetylase family protein [Allorhizobium sp. BGMRC 0089]|uniref:polysaccharide deacetylase family protein n=1 Tax=Allorhizobium sonneratiae TaxID=2934936 RepID=UPI0020342E27|nr:polysaccharide deacetylase family protein [Allorhizobium sonneratiae]MCM2292067.1 polysaccharide deacetylase family protein [Allorhizobium sonneratiae]
MILRLLSSAALVLCLAACATPPDKAASSALKTAFFPVAEKPKHLGAKDPVPMEPSKWLEGDRQTDNRLTGRVLTVSSLADLKLQPKEVLLTFDDGPAAKKTEKILDILDHYHVKGTFMMVGEMAKARPEIVADVEARGHTIGSHTFRHPNLKAMAFDQAMAEVMKGEKAVAAAAHVDEVHFFRFPYLAETGRLRAALAAHNIVVLDADIDSKDYFKDTPETVLNRTMKELEKRKSGIILMHDIHGRTVAMLPHLLERLRAEGYKVVTLHYGAAPTQLLASRHRLKL